MIMILNRSVGSWLAISIAVVVTGCAVQQPPETTELLSEALPETTEVPTDWQASESDTGAVDDAWVASFNDPILDALVAEALENNRNLQAAAAQVDRSAALARLA